MKRVKFPALALMGIMVAACSEQGDTVKTGSSLLGFQPACGSPGDKVLLSLSDPLVQARQGDAVFCKTPERYAVKFAPNASGTVLGSGLAADGSTCQVEATVPADARTGTIQLELTNETDVAKRTKYESRDVFQVPCPGDAGSDANPGLQLHDAGNASDAGGDAGSGDAGSGGDGSIAALYKLLRSGGSTTKFDAYLLGQTTTAQQADVEATVAAELARLTAPGVALGSCGTPTPTPAPTPPVPGVAAGVVTLSNAGTSLATLSPQASNDSTFYEVIMNNAPDDTVLDVAIAGSNAFPSVTVVGALHSAPNLTVTSPDLSGGQVLVPAGDLSLEFTPTMATHMSILIQPLAGGAPTVCSVDPQAGTFTIPGSALGAAGTSLTLTVRLGNVLEQTAGGRRHISIADVSLNGLVSLQ